MWAAEACTLHCLCTDVPAGTPRGRGREAGTRTLCPVRRSHGHECSWPSVVRWEVRGRALPEAQGREPGSAPTLETAASTRVFGQTAQKPAPGEQRSKRHSKQRKRAQCQRSRSPGVRGHCCLQQTARGGQALQGGAGRVVPLAPKGGAQSLLTSSRCWRWCWPRRPHPGRRAGGHSFQGRPRRPSASRGARRSGPARAAPRAAGTGTTG